jgi:hypothetical protein
LPLTTFSGNNGAVSNHTPQIKKPPMQKASPQETFTLLSIYGLEGLFQKKKNAAR